MASISKSNKFRSMLTNSELDGGNRHEMKSKKSYKLY